MTRQWGAKGFRRGKNKWPDSEGRRDFDGENKWPDSEGRKAFEGQDFSIPCCGCVGVFQEASVHTNGWQFGVLLVTEGGGGGGELCMNQYYGVWKFGWTPGRVGGGGVWHLEIDFCNLVGGGGGEGVTGRKAGFSGVKNKSNKTCKKELVPSKVTRGTRTTKGGWRGRVGGWWCWRVGGGVRDTRRTIHNVDRGRGWRTVGGEICVISAAHSAPSCQCKQPAWPVVRAPDASVSPS